MNRSIYAFGLCLIVLAACTPANRNLGTPPPAGSTDQHTEHPVTGSTDYHIASEVPQQHYTSTEENEYSFSIPDKNGNTIKNFAITHTKPMHLIVVKKDLSSFQHLHPEFAPETGKFKLSGLNFPSEGVYRFFADFALEDATKKVKPVTLWEDIRVGSSTTSQPLGSIEETKIFDGYEITLITEDAPPLSGTESTITFRIAKDGRPVTDLEEYLGALGHSVILKEETLDFIHAHPLKNSALDGKVSFLVDFPTAGKYKLFTQFQHHNRVITSDFVISVKENSAAAGAGMRHNEMAH